MRAPIRNAGSGAADPIIRHPAIRRALLSIRARLEGSRCIAYWIAHLLDLGEHDPDSERRAQSLQLASLLTPVAKAFFTENGFRSASAALQVLGGHGYVHENAIEQTLRDSRIAMIYEGTNEIQAIDLLLRKVIGDGGAALRQLLNIMKLEAAACRDSAESGEFGRQLQDCVESVAGATEAIVADAAHDPELPYRLADDYLQLIGLVLLAYAWAKSARVAEPYADAFHVEKKQTAQFFFGFQLPEVKHRLALLAAGREHLPSL